MVHLELVVMDKLVKQTLEEVLEEVHQDLMEVLE
jgi:hypothetical protein